MAKKQRLVVLNGGDVTETPHGTCLTRPVLRNYLDGLLEHFDELVWFAPLHVQDGGAVEELKREGLRVIPYRFTRLTEIFNVWLKLLSFTLTRPYLLWFLPNPMLPVLPLAWLASRRLVVYLGNDFRGSLASDAYQSFFRRHLLRLSYVLPLTMASIVIARGRGLAELAGRYNERVVETVPLGHLQVDSRLELGMCTSSSSVLRILYVGKLLWSKGLEELLRAWKSILVRHPEKKGGIKLDLVGNGAHADELRQRLVETGIAGDVELHGYVSDPVLLDRLFRCAAALVVPTSRYPEGVPRVIDEAIVRGLPVVATRVGGVSEEFRTGEVMLIEPGSTEELERALELLIFDSGWRRRLIQAAAKRREYLLSLERPAVQHADLILGSR
ncbi:MAG: glycosyltransferase [Acidobacteriota bacterium]